MDLFIAGLFWLLAATALVSGVVVVSHRSPVGSVFALIVNSAALAGLYLILGDAFLAAIQVIVYSGAILVLFLFVVMLLDIRHDDLGGGGGRLRRIAVGLLVGSLGILLAMGLFYGLAGLPLHPGAGSWGGLNDMADLLFGRYILVFEAVSVLLVAAMVGVVVLTKRHYVPAGIEPGPGERGPGA